MSAFVGAFGQAPFLQQKYTAPVQPEFPEPIVRLLLTETAGTTAVDEMAVQDGVYVGAVGLAVPQMLNIGGGGIAVRDGPRLRIQHNEAFEFVVTSEDEGWTLGFPVMFSAPLAADGDREIIASKIPTGAHNGDISIERIRTASEERIRVYRSDSGGVPLWIVSNQGFGSLDIGTTYLLWFVQRGPNNFFYINTQEFGPSTGPGDLTPNDGDWFFSGYDSTNGLPFNGCIGPVAFWDIPLTAQQIADYSTPLDTIYLYDWAQNIDEGSGSIDPATRAHPESGFMVSAVTDDILSSPPTVDLTADGAVADYITTDVSENTSASVTIRLSKSALLSRAATVSLTVQPVEGGAESPDPGGGGGDALSVPSLTEFLTNDDTAAPGGATTVTTAAALTSALAAASPGDTIVCNPPGGNGTIAFWNLPNGLAFPNGTSGNYVTVMAALGKGVVISACEDFAGARTPNNGFWNQTGLSSDDVAKKIWRSAATFSGAEQPMTGWWIEYGFPHMLIRYTSLTALRSAYSTANSLADGTGGYATPGVHKASDGRVYIRFQRPHVGKYSVGGTWSPNLWPDNPEAVNGNGQFVWPQSENPNDYVIHLCRATSPSSGPRAFHGVSGSVNTGTWKQIGPGINSLGFTGTVSGSHGIVKRGTHYSWRLGILSDTGSVQEDWFFDRARFTSGFKLSRAEFKFGGPLEDIRDAAFLNSTSMQDLYCRDCTIGGFHEIMVAGISMSRRRFRFRNCCFTRMVDEGFQVGQGMGQVELGYCYFFCAPMGGGGGSGAEQEGDVWYIHHNIIDNRLECVGNWRATPYPRPVHHPHSPDKNQPRKSYNNLVLWGPDQEQSTSLPWMANSHNVMTTTGAVNSNEQFNNMNIRHHPSRGWDVATYSTTGESDALVRFVNCDPDLSNEFMDYNLWYKDVVSPVEGWGRDVRAGANGTGGSAFATLAAFRASALFNTSKLAGTRRGAYAPGFEGNSTDAKPTLPSLDDYPNSQFDYRPAATSVITVATTGSLSGSNWWSGLGPTWGRIYFPWNPTGFTLAPSGWKGALDPNGSTMNVGVLNP